MRLFDTHCHLGGEELAPTAVELATRAFASGVEGFGLISADQLSLEKVERLRSELSAALPLAHVVSTSGVHPHDSKAMDDKLWARVQELGRGPASAIGETGLDYHYDLSDREIQRDAFQKHIELACETKKPLVIHCRNAVADIMSAIEQAALKQHPNPGILHCFTEDLATAKRLLDLNFYISFSGIVSFKNAEALREALAFVPIERLLIETDSPYLAPIPHRGKRNEPMFVRDVFTAVQAVKKIDADALAVELWKNSCRVFALSDTPGAQG